MNDESGVLRAAMSYPFRGDEWRTRLLLGAGLNLLAGVVLAAAVGVAAVASGPLPAPVAAVLALVGVVGYVPLLGYVAATTRSLLSDEEDPPPFGALDDLASDGVRLTAVTVGYALPAVVLLSGAAVVADAVGTGAGGVVGALGLAAALLAAYLLPAALVSVVDRGNLSAATDPEPLRSAASDVAYLRGWAVGAAVLGVGVAAGAALAPVVVGFGVVFLAQVAATYAATRGTAAALDLMVGAPPAPPASGYVPGWDEDPERKELTEGLGGALLPDTHDDEPTDVERPQEAAAGGIATAGAGDVGTDLDTVSGNGTEEEAASEDESTDIEPADGESDDVERYDGG